MIYRRHPGSGRRRVIRSSKQVQRDESRNDITERTVPINVRDQISSANHPNIGG